MLMLCVISLKTPVSTLVAILLHTCIYIVKFSRAVSGDLPGDIQDATGGHIGMFRVQCSYAYVTNFLYTGRFFPINGP